MIKTLKKGTKVNTQINRTRQLYKQGFLKWGPKTVGMQKLPKVKAESEKQAAKEDKKFFSCWEIIRMPN